MSTATRIAAIQAQIDAKQAIIDAINTKLLAVTTAIDISSVPVDYNVDGEQVMESSAYQKLYDSLLKGQEREIEAINKLYKQLSLVQPYFFKSTAF